jgi:hypothetical protein
LDASLRVAVSLVWVKHQSGCIKRGVELLTGIEGASSRPEQRIVVMGER